MTYLRRGNPSLMDPEQETIDSLASDDNDHLRKKAFYALYLIMATTPIVLFLFLPFWERYCNKKLTREEEEEERRLAATKLAEPIREAHLLSLMAGYSKVLSFSDTCDEDRDEGHDEHEKQGTKTGCHDETIESIEGGSIDNFLENDDIEMQWAKAQDSEEFISEHEAKIADHGEKVLSSSNDAGELVIGDNENADIETQGKEASSSEKPKIRGNRGKDCLECDKSQCNYRSFHLPLPGQRVEDANQESSAVATIQRKIHSDGCAVCMNPFEVGERVTWSSNPDCPHVFHHQCLLEWFVAIGTKEWTTKAMHYLDSDVATIQSEICTFHKLCPFCRRDYFLEECREILCDDRSNNSSTASATISSFEIHEDDVDQPTDN